MTGRILPFIAVLFAIGVFFAYINPVYSGDIAAKRAAIAEDARALSAAAAYTAKENELAAARDMIPGENLARLTVFFPDSVNNVQAILDLNALASRTGLSLSSINVSSGAGASQSAGNTGIQAGPAPGVVELSLSATGTYSAFRAFLAGIESSERLIDISGLSLKGSDTGVYSYSMTLRIYWLR